MLFPAMLSAFVFSFPLTFLLRAGAVKYKYEFYFVGSDNLINDQCSTPFNLLSYIAAADFLLETDVEQSNSNINESDESSGTNIRQNGNDLDRNMYYYVES